MLVLGDVHLGLNRDLKIESRIVKPLITITITSDRLFGFLTHLNIHDLLSNSVYVL